MDIDGSMLHLEATYNQIGRKMELLLQTGQTLMENGANSSRIARLMKRVAIYMNIPEEKLHIHITYTTIMANVSDGNHSITKFQKCYKHGVNMTVISAISKLSIRAFEKNYSLEEFGRQLNGIQGRGRLYTPASVTAGAGIACGAFCLLFGCDWPAFFYTAVCAMVGFQVRHYCNHMNLNPYAGIFIAAFVSTCLAFLAHYLPSSTPWHPMLACALFIVPGIPLINAVDDLLENFITAGMTRAMNTLLMVGSMSFGIVSAIKICQVEDFTALSMEPQGSYFGFAIAAAMAAAGFSTIFNAPWRLVLMIALGGVISVCIRNFVAFDLGMGMGIASFAGAMAVSIISLKAVQWLRVPKHVLVIPSVIPMIPGVLMYRTLFGIININELDGQALMQALQSGVNATLIVLGITLGVAIPKIFARKYLDNEKRQDLLKLLEIRNRSAES